jgi:hypothetical protein
MAISAAVTEAGDRNPALSPKYTTAPMMKTTQSAAGRSMLHRSTTSQNGGVMGIDQIDQMHTQNEKSRADTLKERH